MAQNLYETLGVEKTASAQEIKRAYFSLVKKFPPERFPTEFKEIRAAYDILSKPDGRAAYDKQSDLPEDAAALLENAKQLSRSGEFKEAQQVYSEILERYPGLPQAELALAFTYQRQGKNGKAVSLWESICKREPENAQYAFELARSYLERSWNRKAEAQYKIAISLDDSNPEYWFSLCALQMANFTSHLAMQTAADGVKALERYGKEDFRLLSYYFLFALLEELEQTEDILKKLTAMYLDGRSPRGEESEHSFLFLLDSTMSNGRSDLLPYFTQIADAMPEKSVEAENLLKSALLFTQFTALSEEGYDDCFHDLFAVLTDGEEDDDEENQIMLLGLECHILQELATFRPQILRLKEERPQLYEIHAAFFSEALRAKEPDKLWYQRAKKMSKMGYSPMLHKEEQVSTVRREGPKVGRNDPCPCGSGKKYKKCCG